ncbi:MAG: hypothetical protein HZB19_17295 [Chloroflexi bacterium]|nr:hypothetical protein [Chloroflexota bacterium]
MDNWIFLFLGLILAYLLEFTRPWVKSYFEKSSLSIRERRLYILRSRYRYIKILTQIPIMIILPMLRYLALGLGMLIILVAAVGVFLLPQFSVKPLSGEVLAGFILIFAFMAAYPMTRITDEIDDILNFDRHRERVMSKYQKLGGNSEDLDKEETKT